MNMEYAIMLAAIGFGVVYILFGALFKRHKVVTQVPGAKGAVAQDDFAAYRKLAATEPDNPEHWLKWGNALSLSAPNAKNPDLVIHRYNEACACFQRAVDIAPDNSQAWKNWGQALFALYRFQNCEDPALLGQANQKYQNAALLSPNNALIWQQWGDELRQAAHIAVGDLKTSLMEESISKSARGSELNMGFVAAPGPAPAPVQAPAQSAPPKKEDSAG